MTAESGMLAKLSTALIERRYSKKSTFETNYQF